MQRTARTSALLIGGFAAGAAAGIWYGAGTADAQTRVQILPCGIAPGHPAVMVPSGLINQAAGATPISLGPIAVPGLDAPVTLRFVAVLEPRDKQVIEIDNGLSLPILAGEAGRVPDEITLACRHGKLSTVSYRYADSVVRLSIPSAAGQAQADG